MGRRFDHLAVANPNHDWHFTAAAGGPMQRVLGINPLVFA
jgi:hypothetical protein